MNEADIIANGLYPIRQEPLPAAVTRAGDSPYIPAAIEAARRQKIPPSIFLATVDWITSFNPAWDAKGTFSVAGLRNTAKPIIGVEQDVLMANPTLALQKGAELFADYYHRLPGEMTTDARGYLASLAYAYTEAAEKMGRVADRLVNAGVTNVQRSQWLSAFKEAADNETAEMWDTFSKKVRDVRKSKYMGYDANGGTSTTVVPSGNGAIPPARADWKKTALYSAAAIGSLWLLWKLFKK